MRVQRHVSIAVVVAATILAGGCGDPGSSEGAVDLPVDTVERTAAPTATRVAAPLPLPGDSDFVTVTEVSVGDVDEPCPANEPIDMNATESSIVIDESSRLEPMLGVVLQYGNEHPDVFGGYGLHWITAGDASVFVSFTGDLDEHRRALAQLVDYADELIVCQAPASEADRRSIQSTLIAELDGRYLEIGSGGERGVVTVTLDPTEEPLAADLVEQYGAAIEVRVGALAYPLDDAVPVCGPRLEPSLIDGLNATIVDPVTPARLTQAGSAAMTVRLTNTGDQPIRFDSGAPSTVVTDARGAPRTADDRAVADIGIQIALEPGGHQDFDIDVTLASCDPLVGYVVPTSDPFVVVSFYNAELHVSMNSAPLPILITG